MRGRAPHGVAHLAHCVQPSPRNPTHSGGACTWVRTSRRRARLVQRAQPPPSHPGSRTAVQQHGTMHWGAHLAASRARSAVSTAASFTPSAVFWGEWGWGSRTEAACQQGSHSHSVRDSSARNIGGHGTTQRGSHKTAAGSARAQHVRAHTLTLSPSSAARSFTPSAVSCRGCGARVHGQGASWLF